MKILPMFRHLALPAALLVAVTGRGWDYEGHRMVNQLALAALPADFPAFVREPANAERIAFLANLPDRWRNVDPWLKQSGSSWTDHFCDLEQLADAGLDARTVPSLRYDFALAFAAGRAAHADKFPSIDPAKNLDHTREWPGFAPWAITEWSQKLRSAFACLKAFEEVGGTPDDIANAKQDVIYAMGVLGHYVADGAQPLHTTIHHNGWVGANPSGYTTWPGFHSWIDGGFVAKAGIRLSGLAPRVTVVEPLLLGSRADGRDPLFVAAMDYYLASNTLVEPLYQLEKAGLLGNGEKSVSPEGQAFIESRLLKGGHMLATLWLTAHKSAPVDTYLRSILVKRQLAAAPAKATP